MDVSPILLKAVPFDATKNASLQFTQSGNQIFAHRIVIVDNTTNEQVYDKKTSSMALTVTIPASTLVNGKTYNIKISVFDRADQESPFSNPLVIKCLSTPLFYIDNLQDGQVINNASTIVSLHYSQAENELLNEYRVIMYSANKTTVLWDSGIKYTQSALSVKISSLNDDTTYYIAATGKTVNGIEMSTDMIMVMCDYLKPDVFLSFRADNIPSEGCVRLTSNYVSVEGSSNVDVSFKDGEKVILGEGESVYFDKGFIVDNFIMQVLVEGLTDFKKFLILDMGSVRAVFSFNYGYFQPEVKKYFVELEAYNILKNGSVSKRNSYIQDSNRIEPLKNNEQLALWVKHKDGLFDVIIDKVQIGGVDDAVS